MREAGVRRAAAGSGNLTKAAQPARSKPSEAVPGKHGGGRPEIVACIVVFPYHCRRNSTTFERCSATCWPPNKSTSKIAAGRRGTCA